MVFPKIWGYKKWSKWEFLNVMSGIHLRLVLIKPAHVLGGHDLEGIEAHPGACALHRAALLAEL